MDVSLVHAQLHQRRIHRAAETSAMGLDALRRTAGRAALTGRWGGGGYEVRARSGGGYEVRARSGAGRVPRSRW